MDERSHLLGIYLNDHLAGSFAGTDLARRMAKTHEDPAVSSTLEAIAAEIAQDRSALLEIMSRLDLPVRRHKVVAGWLAEKAARLKTNGRLVRRSPLSSLLELEILRLGVEGKAAAWKTLRLLADSEPRLESQKLDTLLERAGHQLRTLEELRLQKARTTFRHA
ncbi:hypothetical protein OG735_38255 [Streptomyces sp. NBC_01210]|uniref:hypothetical protein n=1 Tax=Streptomyces sp. NBC_01210 TaxID=2903774 RepID=UPI002E0F1924|nr:hypothetical protein OG735_38255 [Streptomyces sp. NBC_01210]